MAARKRMWARLIEPLEVRYAACVRKGSYQVKKEDNPDSAKSQSNICNPFSGMVPMYAINPSASEIANAINGRPRLSIYINDFGACPTEARAWTVRVAP